MTKVKKVEYTIGDVMGKIDDVRVKVEHTTNDVVEKIEGVMIKVEHTISDVMGKIDDVMVKIDTMSEETTAHFTALKVDFDRLENKVDAMDVRLTGVEARLGDVEVACTQNTVAIQVLDEKFTQRFDDLESRVYQDLNAISKTLVKHDRIFARLVVA